MEHVNHPKHYNQHPNGIECIDIIRHYTCDIANAIKYLWRAGLKPEMGKEDAEKEIEDLKKALWYIEDYRTHLPENAIYMFSDIAQLTFQKMIGFNIDDVIAPYDKKIAMALNSLFYLGLIRGATVYIHHDYEAHLYMATEDIQSRILEIERSAFYDDLHDIALSLSGQAIDGDHYVSKPGCERDTEPEHYDPLNMVVVMGSVYSLSDEVKKKDNGALYSPCELCDLRQSCADKRDHNPIPGFENVEIHSGNNFLCKLLHGAETNEYYREVGVARYNPHFGTVEVVDETMELERRLKEAKEEDSANEGGKI